MLSTLDPYRYAPHRVGDLSATRTLSVGLAVPAGVTLLRPTDITVTVTVQALAGTRVFSSAIVVTGLLANQTAELDLINVAVLVSGPVPTLAGLPPEQIIASIDAGGRGPGTYIVDVAVRVPSGVSVQTVQPTRVTLTIRPR